MVFFVDSSGKRRSEKIKIFFLGLKIDEACLFVLCEIKAHIKIPPCECESLSWHILMYLTHCIADPGELSAFAMCSECVGVRDNFSY